MEVFAGTFISNVHVARTPTLESPHFEPLYFQFAPDFSTTST